MSMVTFGTRLVTFVKWACHRTPRSFNGDIIHCSLSVDQRHAAYMPSHVTVHIRSAIFYMIISVYFLCVAASIQRLYIDDL